MQAPEAQPQLPFMVVVGGVVGFGWLEMGSVCSESLGCLSGGGGGKVRASTAESYIWRHARLVRTAMTSGDAARPKRLACPARTRTRGSQTLELPSRATPDGPPTLPAVQPPRDWPAPFWRSRGREGRWGCSGLFSRPPCHVKAVGGFARFVREDTNTPSSP